MHLAGRCWGLFLLPAAVAQLTATNFVPYYNYNGDLTVAGTVTVTTDGTSQTLDYSLSNVDALCGAGADSDTANSCGVHVHQGTTCTDDAGSHWYDDEEITEDPWASVSYIGVTSASDTTDPVDTGLTAADLVGRALIIHGYDGGRIACALLTAPAPAPSSAPTPAPYALDWKFYMDPQELSVAAGTTVTFSWSGTHNVWEVPDAAALADCDLSGGSEVAPSSVQTVNVAAPDAPTTKYYVCQEPGHCDADQKIAITWAAPVVAPTAAPTPRPSVAATPAPTNSSDEPTQNIVELAQANDFLSTLVQAVIAADLVDTLSGDGPFTVFAPTNDAFAALPNGTLEELLLPENKETLKSILKYHVVPGTVLSSDLTDGDVTTVQGSDITVTTDPVTINGANVVQADVMASNGVVHVIDTVLIPPAPPTPAPVASAQNIVQLAQATSNLSTLVDAVIAADLVDTLSGDGPFTVFAPTNDAFAALPEGTLEELLLPENKETLKSILKYHVVSGTVLSTDLTEGDVPTLEGDTVKVSLGDTVMINNATVITPDVLASNGVVHVIDTVLIPPTTPAPTPAPSSGEFSGPAPTINPTPATTAETVVINSQLVLAEVTVDETMLETIVKAALVATLSSVTSADQIVAFSVVSLRRRRLQQSTTTVAFSVRVEGTAEFAANYAETIVSELSAGTLTTALNTAADDQGVQSPSAPADLNDYDTIMAATVVDGAPTPQPVATTPVPSRRPTPQPVRQPTRRPTPQPVRQPTRRPTPRPTASTAGMEEEDGSEDQGEDESEDKGADSASGGLAVLGIALAAFIGLLCVGGYVRMKMFGSQDRSDRDWARDLHGSGVSNPAAARDPWGRPTPSETRGVELASSHGLRSYH